MQECYHLHLTCEQEKMDSYISCHKVCIRKYHQSILKFDDSRFTGPNLKIEEPLGWQDKHTLTQLWFAPVNKLFNQLPISESILV